MGLSVKPSSGAEKEEGLWIVQALERVGRARGFRAGDFVFEQGEASDSLFVMKSGVVELRLKLEEDREEVLGVVRGGELFGELELIDGETRASSAVVVEDCRLVEIGGETFKRIEEEVPSFGFDLLSWAAGSLLARLGAANELLDREMAMANQVDHVQGMDFKKLLTDTFQVEVSLREESASFAGRVVAVTEAVGDHWIALLNGDRELVLIPYQSIAGIRGHSCRGGMG